VSLLEWNVEHFLSLERNGFKYLEGIIIAESGSSMDFIFKMCYHIHRSIPHDKWSADILLILQTAGPNKAARHSSGVCVQTGEVKYRVLC
jgi:hypothetical protein